MTTRRDLPDPDFRTLFESAPGSYLVLSPDLTIVAVSDAYLRATMTQRAEILGRGLFEVFPDNPDEVGATGTTNLRASLERVLEHGGSDTMAVQKYDIRRPESEGGGFEERFWSPVNSGVRAGGRIAYIIHRVEDVTEFVRLRQAESQQDKIAEALRSHAADMEVEVYRRAQEIQDANRQLRELQSDLEQRVEDRTFDLRAANEELQRQIAERERTELALRRSEAQLRQSQKLEAVGRLAGGVAHDFNNMLSVILSYTSLLADDMPADDSRRADVLEIQKAGERAADLTHQLLAFSSQQLVQPRILDLNEVIKSIERMIRRLVGEDVAFRSVHAADLGKVKADPGHVEQVLINLVVNARDAMPGGGTLTIETQNMDVDAAYAAEHFGVTPGPHVMLAVSDTGVGMDRATQQRIFEPFFTTKEKGKGTGLGLSTVFGIVQQSGGCIWVYSEPGRGATFKVFFPRTDEAEPASALPVQVLGTRGVETVLLVEDDDQLRAVAQGVLRRNGYRVLEARNGIEAIERCEEHQEPIHVLLTDVIMPKMNGKELAERLTPLRPQMRVLYMSGYTENAFPAHFAQTSSPVDLLQKPFTPDRLLKKLREVLDAQKVGTPPRTAQ